MPLVHHSRDLFEGALRQCRHLENAPALGAGAGDQRRVACLLIASDLDEILGNCTRALVMRGGALAGELDREAMSEAQIMYLATGVN